MATTPKKWVNISFSAHARKRMRQRCVSLADVQYVLQNGEVAEDDHKHIYRLSDVDDAPWWHRVLRALRVVVDPSRYLVVTLFYING